MAEIILAEQTLNFSDKNGGGIYEPFDNYPATFPLVTGEIYTVVWDGVEYVCTAKVSQEYADYGGICIGNETITNNDDGYTDTGEPFCILYSSQMNMNVISTKETAETHTVAIYGDEGYLLKDQTLAFELETNSETVYYNNEVAPAITTGNTYTVIWDGDYYECVAKEWTGTQGDASIDFIVLGNLNIRDTAEENTGEPFFYMYAPAFTLANFLTLETDASHVVSLYDGKIGYLFENVELEYNEAVGAWTSDSVEGVISLGVGKTYTITINGTDYECIAKAMNGGVAIGNTSFAGGEDTGELFCCILEWSDENTVPIVFWLDETPLESCTVSLYEGIKPTEDGGGDSGGDTEEATSVNLVLLDRNGNPVTYEGIKTVSFNTADGKIATFTLSAISSN